MSKYPPPSYLPPQFNPAAFETARAVLSRADLQKILQSYARLDGALYTGFVRLADATVQGVLTASGGIQTTGIAMTGALTGPDADAWNNQLAFVKSNNTRPVVYPPFDSGDNTGCRFYFDFGNSSNLGQDVSGRGKSVPNTNGIKQVIDSVRGPCALFDPILAGRSNGGYYELQRVLRAPENLDMLSEVGWSISFWVKPTGVVNEVKTFFAITSDTISNTNILCAWNNGNLFFRYRVNNTVIVGVNAALTLDTWAHIVVTNDNATGNAVYLNGVLQSGYTTGNGTIVMDTSAAVFGTVPKQFTIGGTMEPHEGTTIPRSDYPKFTWPMNGRISDFLGFGRKLSATEVTALYNDNYGYYVVAIAGQSNAAGSAPIVAGIDDVYTTTAYQYNTYANISADGTTVLGNSIIVATNPIQGMLPAPGTGPWKTLVEDIAKYMPMARRKKILVLPMARGGTGFLTTPSWLQYPGDIHKKAIDEVMNPAKYVNGLNSLLCSVWMHGEAEINFMNNNYASDVTAFWNATPFFNKGPMIITAIPGDFNVTSVVGGVTVDWKRRINNVLRDLVATTPPTWKKAFLEVNDLSLDVNVHFDAPAVRLVGSRIYDAMCKLYGISNLKTTTQAITINQDVNNVGPVVVHTPLVLEQGSRIAGALQYPTFVMTATSNSWTTPPSSIIAPAGLSLVAFTLALPTASASQTFKGAVTYFHNRTTATVTCSWNSGGVTWPVYPGRVGRFVYFGDNANDVVCSSVGDVYVQPLDHYKLGSIASENIAADRFAKLFTVDLTGAVTPVVIFPALTAAHVGMRFVVKAVATGVSSGQVSLVFQALPFGAQLYNNTATPTNSKVLLAWESVTIACYDNGSVVGYYVV